MCRLVPSLAAVVGLAQADPLSLRPVTPAAVAWQWWLTLPR